MAGGADALARSKQIYKGSEIREPGSGVPTSRGAYRNCFGDSRRRLVLGIATIVAGGNNKGNSGPNQTSNGVFESIIDTSTPTKVGYSRLNVVRCYPIESGDHVRNPGPIITAAYTNVVQGGAFCNSKRVASNHASHKRAVAVAIIKISSCYVDIINNATHPPRIPELLVTSLNPGINDVSLDACARVYIGECVVSTQSGTLVDSIETPVSAGLICIKRN